MSFKTTEHSRIGTVYGVLLNDPREVARLAPQFAAAPYGKAPVAPILYIKSRNTFATDGSAVSVPDVPGLVRIDGTVGAVIARTATRVCEAEALSFVAGYVVVSDVALPHDSCYRPAVRQRCRDGFCPIGSFVPADGVDPAGIDVSIVVNDREVHRRSLATLVRTLPRLIGDITDFMTLDAGDILLLGTPDEPPLARPGDRIRIDATGLASVSHTLVREGVST